MISDDITVLMLVGVHGFTCLEGVLGSINPFNFWLS